MIPELNITILISAFLLGLGSSLHCIGMCGPLVMAVPFPKSRENFVSKSLYFIGKATAYGTLGCAVGFLGWQILFGKAQQYLSLFSGIMILLLLVVPLLKIKLYKFPFQKQFQKLFHRIKTNPRAIHFFQLGFLNGLLPCGMVYMAMAVAFAGGSAWTGFFAMFLFGLGTMPALWLLTIAKKKVKLSRTFLKKMSTGIAVVVALLLILRGLGLGIPYVSPQLSEKPMSQQGDSSQKVMPKCH